MNFSKFDIRMFNEARMEAESSEFKRFHTGAVIVYKKHIIGRGKNDDKSHPMQRNITVNTGSLITLVETISTIVSMPRLPPFHQYHTLSE